MIELTSLEMTKAYLRGVAAAAKHHAPDVEYVIPAIAGAVMTHLQGNPWVREAGKRPGRIGLAMQFETRRGRYALSYDHLAGDLALKQGSFKGPVLRRFNNYTSLIEIDDVFSAL